MRLGVIGGLGPMATVYFLQLITEMTNAGCDQEHMEILVYSKPSIPDRTRFITGESRENPLYPMVETGKVLTAMGAEVIAVPCITAHYFHDELEKRIGKPVINSIKESAAYLKRSKIEKVGILATTGTISSGIFHGMLKENNIEVIVPEAEMQKELMNIIYQEIKKGKEPNVKVVDEIGNQLRRQGAQVILLGCTELSLLKKEHALGAGYLDIMDITAACAVRQCGVIKPGYEDLITRG